MATTVLTGQQMAMSINQDVLIVSRATHLADLAAARSFKLGELAAMITLIIEQLGLPVAT